MSDRKYLRTDEIEELRTAFRSWTRENRVERSKYLWVFLVLFHTGARVREVLFLKDTAFDEKTSSIVLPRLKLRKTKPGQDAGSAELRKEVTKRIPINASAMDEIINARVLAGTTQHTIPAYTSFLAVFKDCCKRAGITSKVLQHPHALRHSFAMYLLDSGLDVVSVKKMLGHASINSTMVYLDKTTEDIGDDMRKKGLLRS